VINEERLRELLTSMGDRFTDEEVWYILRNFVVVHHFSRSKGSWVYINTCHHLKVLSHMTVDRVWIGGSIYWPLTHNSELQVITVLTLISTLYNFSSLLCLSSNSFWRAILQLPALTSLLSGTYPATELVSSNCPANNILAQTA
jgi:hypothetical protein